jgi:hypothetical protein
MTFNNFLLTDTQGKKSTTLTVFILGAIVVNLKLIFSGMIIGGVTLAEFTGSDYGVAMGALGGIYVLRRTVNGYATPKSEEGKSS